MSPRKLLRFESRVFTESTYCILELIVVYYYFIKLIDVTIARWAFCFPRDENYSNCVLDYLRIY